MSPRSFWDWAVNPTGVAIAPQISLSELAVRLGSIASFDRMGEILFLDSFEDGLGKWETSAVGTGASVTLSTAEARSGAYSALLTGGSDGTRDALLRRRLPFPIVSKMGIEYSARIPSGNVQLDWAFQVFDGTNSHTFRIRWTRSTATLAYFNGTGAYVTFGTGIDLRQETTLFHTGKLIVDASTKTYVRFKLNNISYSLADITGRTIPSASLPHALLLAYLVSSPGFNNRAYIDDFILTQNEP